MLIIESVLSKICVSNVVLLFFLEKSFAMPLSNITNNSTNGAWCDSDCVELRDQLALAAKIFCILISILIILGNTLVLLVTWRERSLHQPNKYFIACLAVADLFVGIFIGPMVVYGWGGHGHGHRGISIHFCRFIVWIDTLALTASIYSLMFISFDRYLKISKPLQYRSRMTTSKSLKIIFIVWLISTAFATYAATPGSGGGGFLVTNSNLCFQMYSHDKVAVFYTFLYISVIFFPTIVILIMYALIFVVAHKRQKMLRNGELGETGQNQRSVLRQDLKIVRMLLTVVGVFLFCWLPLSIFVFFVHNNPNAFKDWNFLSLYAYLKVVCLLPLINSLCNPLIYACLDQTYREAFKHLFQKMMCRTRSNTQQQPAVIELRPQRNN